MKASGDIRRAVMVLLETNPCSVGLCDGRAPLFSDGLCPEHGRDASEKGRALVGEIEMWLAIREREDFDEGVTG